MGDIQVKRLEGVLFNIGSVETNDKGQVKTRIGLHINPEIPGEQVYEFTFNGIIYSGSISDKVKYTVLYYPHGRFDDEKGDSTIIGQLIEDPGFHEALLLRGASNNVERDMILKFRKGLERKGINLVQPLKYIYRVSDWRKHDVDGIMASWD